MTAIQPPSRLLDYLLILESACVPEKPLLAHSRQTPEWELVEEIRQAFGIPKICTKRSQLAAWLAENVVFDDFMVFFINLARPVVLMARDIYEFLAVTQKTIGTAKGVEKILCRDRSEFPFDTSSFENFRQVVESTAPISSWKLGMLSTLTNCLGPAAIVLGCPNHSASARCPHRSECGTAGRAILSDLMSLREALRAFVNNPGGHPIPQEAPQEESAGGHDLPWDDVVQASATLHAIEQLEDEIKGWASRSYCASSDCLPGQVGQLFRDLWTTARLREVSDRLEAAKEGYDTKVQALCDFFQLPYWRQRNDLFEIWVLVQACADFSDIQLGCIDLNGHWRIPGNQQGTLNEPVLTGISARGIWSVFTGVRIRDYQFDFERPAKALRKKAPADAMPDWLFCRKESGGCFDYGLMAGVAEEFRSRTLIPELVVECKAGSSYSLIDTVRDPMEARYASLLRTPEGRSVLVNYRPFHLTKELQERPDLVTGWLARFGRLSTLAPLYPGHLVEEYREAIRRVVGGPLPPPALDLVVVIDDTGSMKDYLDAARASLSEHVRAVAKYGDVRTALVTAGCGEEMSVLVPLDGDGEFSTALDRVTCGHACPNDAAYEAALRQLAAFPWRNDARKMVVFLGDEEFREHSGARWRNELQTLFDREVTFLVVYPGRDQKVEPYLRCLTLENGGEMIDAEPADKLHERLSAKVASLISAKFQA